MTADKLYWADLVSYTISVVNTDGSDPRTLVTDEAATFYGVLVHECNLYISDKNRSRPYIQIEIVSYLYN